MFYPVDSLKRGGRFYLCWVADSWPLRFAAITHRQLWSQDIRQLCDDLLEVMTTESGRPANRFSLRLSSQLMRGLVRLYERKVTVLLGDLCMVNAHVFKSTNKKFVVHEAHERPLRPVPQLPAAVVLPEEPENEQRVEEMIQNSGNVVTNIQDITLKEAAIPDFQLPPNDGFGEEHPDQALASILADRTVEMMMAAETSGAHGSGLDLPADVADKSHDRSRVPHDAPQMEAIAELDVTLFRKSTAEDLLPAYEKDVPEIPDIPHPELPAPTEPAPPLEVDVITQQPQEEIPAPAEEPPQEPAPAPPVVPENLELEELEDQPAAKRRRVKTKLIIDKKIKLGSDFLRARVDNPNVELRCEDFTDAIILVRTPADMLFRRPAAGGSRLHPAVSGRLCRLFQRNLGVVATTPLAERQNEEQQETEQVRQRQRRTRSALDKIPEVEEPQQQEIPSIVIHPDVDTTRRETEGPGQIDVLNATDIPNITTDAFNITGVPNVLEQQDLNLQVPMDIADLPTQKLETHSQAARKRTSEYESPPKRMRSVGYKSFRESQKQKDLPPAVVNEPDKENIPPGTEQAEQIQETPRPLVDAHVSTMLQEAGLADIQPGPMVEVSQGPQESQAGPQGLQESQARARRDGSESSETQLGSLDRTKVSLGDSVTTTDSQRFIRNQWGIEGTMIKIMRAVKAGGTVSVSCLLQAGPVMAGHRAIIAARCFTSILKLKQHGFIRIVKDPETLEILDMTLGPKFDNM